LRAEGAWILREIWLWKRKILRWKRI
jgi:hypothetical protein